MKKWKTRNYNFSQVSYPLLTSTTSTFSAVAIARQVEADEEVGALLVAPPPGPRAPGDAPPVHRHVGPVLAVEALSGAYIYIVNATL